MPTDDALRSPDASLAALFRRSAHRFADRDAVVSESVRLTYRELDARSNQLARVLGTHGIGHGQRIAVLSTTRPEYVEAYLAAAKLGITVVALNIRMHRDELVGCVERSSPRLLLCSPDQHDTTVALHERCAGLERIICFGDAYERLIAPAADDALDSGLLDAVSGDETHNILFTSGTTGVPKGALISQRAAACRAARIVDWYGLTERDGFIGWLPLFHCGGDEPLYATLLSGGCFAAIEKAVPEAMYRLVERWRLTWTLLLPGVITDFMRDESRSRYDLSSLRFAIGYANMMPGVVRELTALLDIDFWDAFGQTETSFLLAHGLIRPGEEVTLRKTPTRAMEIRIVDDELNERPVGEPGECVVRGPSLMSGYLDDPQATAEVFRGGWLHTGDVLVRNDDDTLTYVDRKKYLIKTGGENVYPTEVERVILDHPAVQEVCVHGIPDAHWGEAVRAAVVLKPGQTLTPAEVAAFCRQRLGGYKRPRYVQFLAAEEIPRSTTGKVLRHELQRIAVSDDQRCES